MTDPQQSQSPPPPIPSSAPVGAGGGLPPELAALMAQAAAGAPGPGGGGKPTPRMADQLLRGWRLIKAAIRWLGPEKPLSRCAPPAESSPPEGRLAELARSYPLPNWVPLARGVMASLVLFVVWASFAELDEVAIATGEVVPEGKVKVIQHLEGGVVREIYVADGDVVKEGQPLLQLDLSASSMNKEEMQVRLDALMLQRARQQAEIEGASQVAFPPDEARRQPVLVAAESRNFDSRRQATRATLAVLRDQARQKELEIQELETRLKAVSSNLRISRERFAMSSDLIKSGLMARMEHVQLQGQVEELEGQLDVIRASTPKVHASLAEARSKIEEEQAKFIRTVQGELAETELNIARTRELLTQASDQQRRTHVTSPIEGVVKNLRTNTIGGVVRAGDPIMEIVPLHERLLIDSKLNPMDRGYVQVGQKATVKLSAYDYTTYGGLDGTVILVAPDTTTGPDNQPFYRVVVQTDRAYLGDENYKRAITAGMQATTEIHTANRTVMNYLIKPVLKLRHEAFRER